MEDKVGSTLSGCLLARRIERILFSPDYNPDPGQNRSRFRKKRRHLHGGSNWQYR
jgi:hypothetical protein